MEDSLHYITQVFILFCPHPEAQGICEYLKFFILKSKIEILGREKLQSQTAKITICVVKINCVIRSVCM